jgi:O-antigen/teichoic acid export membrane protein
VTSLRANAAWALVGNVGYAACQWAVLVVVARLGTSTDVGCLALGLALGAPVFILANLQLRAVQATDARHEHAFGVYLGLRLITTAAALVTIAGVVVALGYDQRTLGVVLAIALAKAFEAVSDVTFGLLQQAERLRRMALSQLGRGALTVVGVALVLDTTGSLVAAMLVMALLWGVWLAMYDFPSAARIASIRPRFTLAALRTVAWLALPLGGVSFLGSLTTNLPRYALEAHLGTAALGRFAALAYLIVATTQPVLALGAATTPRLARYFATDVVAYRTLSRRSLALSAGLGATLFATVVLFGREAIAWSYGPEYAGDAPLLGWLAAAAALSFLSTALGAAITAARRFPPQLAVAALACVVCGVSSQLLVPRYAMLGAAWAVLAGEAARFGCLVALHAGTRAARPVAHTQAVTA